MLRPQARSYDALRQLRGDKVRDAEGEHRPMVLEAQPDPRPGGDRVVFRPAGGPWRRTPDIHADVFPPWIFLQSPAGSSTNDFGSRACVAWPAQECAPSAQSFLPTALMP